MRGGCINSPFTCMAGWRGDSTIQAQVVGRTVVSRQTTHNYIELTSLSLNDTIVSKIDCLEDCENPMQVGIFSSQDCQYSRKVADFHQPWTITIKGSTPINNKWIVPPNLKLASERCFAIWQSDLIAPRDKPVQFHWVKGAISAFETKEVSWGVSEAVNSQMIEESPLHAGLTAWICPHDKFTCWLNFCSGCPERVESKVRHSYSGSLRCVARGM